METEEGDFWLDILETNLTDENYETAGDDETHFKLAAIQKLRRRHEELETMLTELGEFRRGLEKIIAGRL